MKLVDKEFFLKLLPLLYLLIQGCSLQQFSEKLSNSFDYPEKIQSEGDIEIQEEVIKSKESIKIKQRKISLTPENEGGTINSNSRKVKKQKQLEKTSSKKKLSKDYLKPTNPKLLPYRIIIKLSAANSAAPAEKVTKALRESGIKFEVEKIELFELQSETKDFPVKR